jgi:hypothetical protein
VEHAQIVDEQDVALTLVERDAMFLACLEENINSVLLLNREGRTIVRARRILGALKEGGRKVDLEFAINEVDNGSLNEFNIAVPILY